MKAREEDSRRTRRSVIFRCALGAESALGSASGVLISGTILKADASPQFKG